MPGRRMCFTDWPSSLYKRLFTRQVHKPVQMQWACWLLLRAPFVDDIFKNSRGFRFLCLANFCNINFRSVILSFFSCSVQKKLDGTLVSGVVLWHGTGQVFILGCTNAGKSTLFNTLLSSDFCRIAARDILKRATASIWPGEQCSIQFHYGWRPVTGSPVLRPKHSLTSHLTIDNAAQVLVRFKLKKICSVTFVGCINSVFNSVLRWHDEFAAFRFALV